jgi:hypothetical protein
MTIYRYPTGEKTVDELTEFAAARLPTIFGKPPQAFNDKPSMAENWWIEDRLAENFSCPLTPDNPENGLRTIYRWARIKANNERLSALAQNKRSNMMTTEDHAMLLLHQIGEFIPTMAMKALEIHQEQKVFS